MPPSPRLSRTLNACWYRELRWPPDIPGGGTKGAAEASPSSRSGRSRSRSRSGSGSRSTDPECSRAHPSWTSRHPTATKHAGSCSARLPRFPDPEYSNWTVQQSSISAAGLSRRPSFSAGPDAYAHAWTTKQPRFRWWVRARPSAWRRRSTGSVVRPSTFQAGPWSPTACAHARPTRCSSTRSRSRWNSYANPGPRRSRRSCWAKHACARSWRALPRAWCCRSSRSREYWCWSSCGWKGWCSGSVPWKARSGRVHWSRCGRDAHARPRPRFWGRRSDARPHSHAWVRHVWRFPPGFAVSSNALCGHGARRHGARSNPGNAWRYCIRLPNVIIWN